LLFLLAAIAACFLLVWKRRKSGKEDEPNYDTEVDTDHGDDESLDADYEQFREDDFENPLSTGVAESSGDIFVYGVDEAFIG
jgi:hypothetical protein